MGRFDKYVGTDSEERRGTQSEPSTTPLEAAVLEGSPLSKLSLAFGHIFFRIGPVARLGTSLTRRALGSAPFVDAVPAREAGALVCGLPFLGIMLALLFLIVDAVPVATTFMVTCMLVGLIVFARLKTHVQLGPVGIAAVTSQEVVSFISWLILLMQAGLNLRQALDYYVANETGSLATIVHNGLKRVQTGESSLEGTLGTIAADIRRDDLRNVFGLILQANKQGTPISEALSSFFEHYQAELMATAEQHGAAANEKATFLLTFEVFLLMGLFLIGMIQSMASGSLF